jgi:DNA-binding MarR family transcriptional regulator
MEERAALRQKVQSSVEECAREILDDVPLAMRTIRTQLRKNGAIEISIPQFRTLVFINRRSGASLSDAAEHMGLTLPSMSAMIDGLVSRNLVMRRTDSQDRRRMTLTLTERGRTTLQKARESTLAYLSELLKSASAADRAVLVKGMQILKSIFAEQTV